MILIDNIDLKPYVGAHIRIGVPDDSGIKGSFNWYGILEKVSKLSQI